MCYAVYLGTDVGLQVSEFNVNKPDFYIGEIDKLKEGAVRNQFTKRNVYYIGSHEGCGCGFVFQDSDAREESGQEEKFGDNKKSVKNFCDLIRSVLSQSDDCEVFLCWEGNQADVPENEEVVKVDFFESGNWVEDEATLYKVAK